MPIAKSRDAEPIRGYRLLEPLGSGGFGEVWKCEAPGGICKAIKFVYGDLGGLASDSLRAEEELRAVQRIKSIRHPFLLSMDRVESVDGELMIITELADHNLDELREKHCKLGRPGIPRGELLGYLREAAEVLDILNLKFDLQHLDIKPRNLFLVSNHVKVADFGLVTSLAGAESKGSSDKIHMGALTPLYSAPEVFLGKLSRYCDQYSLAIVFQELLTGKLPFTGQNSRQLLLQHTKAEPDLSSLPSEDRPIVARALAKNPDQRYSSCNEFLRALAHELAATDPDVLIPLEPVPPLGETQHIAGIDTESYRLQRRSKSPEGILSDHTFVACLGQCPLFDLWQVRTPNGNNRLAKLLYGFDGWDEQRVLDAATRLDAIHHPALVPAEVAHVEPGRIVLLTDCTGRTIRDRFQQCQAAKLPGIPRSELIDHFRAAAEVLDYLYQQHAVQHLGLNTRNLVLEQGWLQIADFGPAQLLWLAGGHDITQRNARYAAPELFAQSMHRSSDQYSLALLYAEMLTGIHPFADAATGSASRQAPDLEKLPALDCEVIARALDPDPAKRWPSCADMLLALEGIRPKIEQKEEAVDGFTAMIRKQRTPTARNIDGATPGNLRNILGDIIKSAGGKKLPTDQSELPQLSPGGDQITYTFNAGVPLGAARDKLELLQLPWPFERARGNDEELAVQVGLPAGMWRQLFGKAPKMELRINLRRVQPRSATPIEVSTQISVQGCGRAQGQKFLDDLSPIIFDILKTLFLTNSDKRTEDRLSWPHPMRVIPLRADGKHEEAVDCRGKDISPGGLGFYLPHELATTDVLIELPNLVHPPAVRIPATLLHAHRSGDGWYDVGALFRFPSARQAKKKRR